MRNIFLKGVHYPPHRNSYRFSIERKDKNHPIYTVENNQGGSLGEILVISIQNSGEIEHFSDEINYKIPDGFLSVGLSENYYKQAESLDENEKDILLNSLNDAFFCDKEGELRKIKIEKYLREKIIKAKPKKQKVSEKLKISIYPYNESLNDNERPHIWNEDELPLKLDFHFDSESFIPSEVHAIIGPNGSGKTKALEKIKSTYQEEKEVILLSHSIYDKNASPPEELTRQYELLAPKGKSSIFFNACYETTSESLIKDIVVYLESRHNGPNPEATEGHGVKIYNKFSSGQCAAFSMLIDLAMKANKNSLILLDEPETYLHPKLLSGFMRAISYIAQKKHIPVIVATHSPIVIQEIPKSCTWIFRRTGNITTAHRPIIETFGAGLSQISEEVFGLDGRDSGFYNILKKKLESGVSKEELSKHVGMEAIQFIYLMD